METTENSPSSNPPRNSGVRQLVSGKRQFTLPMDNAAAEKGFRGWHERGYLPHRDEPGLTQFVTVRLADSFPESLRSEWKHLWQIEENSKRRVELEFYLDRCLGTCHLRRKDIAKLVEDALLFFHPERYELKSWVIMPNHVHILLKIGSQPLSRVMENWKKYTAHEANKCLGHRGKFWHPDYWDTYMRSDAHELKVRRYIENNPTKAKLVRDPKDWHWSSARLRDEFGALKI
jgi:putative transposase